MNIALIAITLTVFISALIIGIFKKNTILITLTLYFFMALIHNLGHPVTPSFVGELGIPDYMFGIFFALMSLGLVVGGPFWGILGDHKDKRKLMFIGLMIYSIGQYIFGNVHNVYIMIIVRFISGFGVSAPVTLLMSYLIQKSDPEFKKRNVAFGLAGLALGASVSYKIGGVLPEFLNTINSVEAAELIFLLQALLNIIFAVGIVVLLQPCIAFSTDRKPGFIESIKNIKDLDRNLLIFLTSLTFVSIGAINISKYLEVYIDDIGGGTDGIGNFVFWTGIVGIFSTAVVVPIIIKFKKDVTIMIIINILSAIIIFSVFQLPDIMTSLYTLFMTYVVLKSVYAPLETSMISSYAKDHEYGKFMGIRQFFFAIGFVIGPIVGGVIYQYEPIFTFYFSVLMFMIAASLVLLVKHNLDIK